MLVTGSLQLTAFSQYWQQEVNYNIDVALNDQNNTLKGFLKLDYTNNSPDKLDFIWFHLWPNAYKNDRTAFSDQLLENGNTKFYFSSKEEKGYINRLDFKVDNITAGQTYVMKIVANPEYLQMPEGYGVIKIISIVNDGLTSKTGGNDDDYVEIDFKYFAGTRFGHTNFENCVVSWK